MGRKSKYDDSMDQSIKFSVMIDRVRARMYAIQQSHPESFQSRGDWLELEEEKRELEARYANFVAGNNWEGEKLDHHRRKRGADIVQKLMVTAMVAWYVLPAILGLFGFYLIWAGELWAGILCIAIAWFLAKVTYGI